MSKPAIRVEYVPLADVQRWPRNPKAHAHAELEKSVRRFGFVQPLLLDEQSGRLVAGHGRLETLQRMLAAGEEPPANVRASKRGWEVPVLRGVSFKDEHEAEAFLLADNRLNELGGWDDAELAAMLVGLADVDGLLDGVGFDDDAVQVARQILASSAPDAEQASHQEGGANCGLPQQKRQPQNPNEVEFKEYDESVEGDVEWTECPKCSHRWPA